MKFLAALSVMATLLFAFPALADAGRYQAIVIKNAIVVIDTKTGALWFSKPEGQNLKMVSIPYELGGGEKLVLPPSK